MDHGASDDGLARLRETAAAVAALDDPASGTEDPMEHADRFEALHEALTSALARAGDAPRSSTTPSDRG